MTRHGAEPLRSGTPEHAALEAELRDWMGRRADAVTAETVRVGEVPLPAVPVRGRRVPLRLALPVAALAVAAAGWAVLGTAADSDAPRPVRVPPAAPAPQTGAPTPSTSAPAPAPTPVATASSPPTTAPSGPPPASRPPSHPPGAPSADTPSSARRPSGPDDPARTVPPVGEGRRVG
ncbi:hypothetical protein [Embleya scabrispora]|uniref:hypothetical protein n=1 Tax=Embleya scabrispora TaxID=159449 RepID=UPI0003750ED8|nr:hypothetical protein [Embleya scabrispora]MYS83955.1 hypothetical protein [Streptomyces sp. SID5474]